MRLSATSSFEQVTNVVGVALPAAALSAPALAGYTDAEKRRVLANLIQDEAVSDASITAAIAAHPSAVMPQLVQRPANSAVSRIPYGGKNGIGG